MTTDELLTADEAAAKYKIHPKTFKAWARDGKVPKPVQWPGARAGRWRASDIQRHISQLDSQ